MPPFEANPASFDQFDLPRNMAG